MGIKGLIFDFDGTIVSQHIDFKRIFEEIHQLLLSYDMKEPEKHLPILEYLDEVKKLNGKKAQKFLDEANRILLKKEKQASKKASPIKGVPEFLEELINRGFFVGIVTRNSRTVVEDILKNKKIPYHILLAREDVRKVKPHPSHIDEMRKKLHIKKSETMVVGDHPFDIIAARKLPAVSCGVLSGGRKPDDFVNEGADFVYKDITYLKYFLGLSNLPEGKIDYQLLRYLIKKYCVLDKSVLTGPEIGIDAALVKTTSQLLALKIDPITLVSQDAGEYAVNVSANDIVCMGAIPKWFFASVILPSKTRFPDIEKLFSDVSIACRKLKIAWVGGHTEISFSVLEPVITGAMVGERMPGIKQEKDIKENDVLILVKEVGIEGASILARKNTSVRRKFPELAKKALESIKKPGISIVNEAILAWKSVPVIRMHDPTEGGLASGIVELAESLQCGFLIEEKKIKIYKPAKIFCDYLGIDIYGLISSGCLLVVVPQEYAATLVSVYKNKKVSASIIGFVTKEKKVLLKKRDNSVREFSFAQDQIIGV